MRLIPSKTILAAGFVLALAFTFSCSDSSEGNKPAPARKEKISGVSQKGPFVRGSSVTLFELNGNLVQTGNSFQSTITNNEGFFEINGISFASPYVRLKVDGYYYNEVSGKQSTSSITLYAIADLTNKSSLNVNLLTHLEHEKVQKLVEEGETFAKAKKRAQQEILKAFGISGDFADSEDMSIFGSSEGSAILLAISVLLQGERTEASFTDLLMDFNQSIKNSSEWSIAKRTELADWASGADFRKIRDNITAWGLAYEVPIFEKYVRKFWSDNYGLGECNPAGKELTAPNVNPLSRNEGRYYVCNGNYWEPVGNAPSSSSSDGVAGSSSSVESSSSIAQGSSSSLAASSSSIVQSSSSLLAASSSSIVQSSSSSLAASSSSVVQSSACGSGFYNPETQFCFGTGIYDKCGGGDYIPLQQFCHGGSTVVNFCGTTNRQIYDPDLYECKPEISSGTYLKGGVELADRTYSAVLIGTQVWMAENLNYRGTDPDTLGICYNKDAANCGKYGRLYDWATIMKFPPDCNSSTDCSSSIWPKHQGICPDGWHLPSDAEWTTLTTYVSTDPVQKLKANSSWGSTYNGTDIYGFSALPGGFNNSGQFSDVGYSGYWWAATEYSATNAYRRNITYNSANMSSYSHYKSHRISVRCVQD